ncbi:uncharacterized protein LOC110053509 [Orbicella faveolata]|uniref:uncharacterized protein LOC110053509 n=1 Tax=Orbicella faveolata TaxID=48498 RepID=UPI0009E4F56B|nr:uncharacterized protein LOC110053509 [Orbicella faveolata]
MLGSRPPSPKASFRGIKRQESVIEDLIEEMETKVEDVNKIIDEGNQIIDDDSVPEKERKVVHEKMIALHDEWNRLATLTSGRQLIVQVLLLKKEQSYDAQDLRRKRDSLMIWISSAENKLNTQFPISQDLDTVTKQKYDLEDFIKEMLSQQRELDDTLETEDKLLKDSDLPEDDRTAIQKEVLDLSYRWKNLEELVSTKTGRIDETFQKLRIQEEDELREWREGLDEVNGWVIVKINSPTRLAPEMTESTASLSGCQ